MYWHDFGVTSPVVEQFLIIGQMPQGIWTKPGAVTNGLSIARYRLLPSICTIRSALPSYTTVFKMVSRSSSSRFTYIGQKNVFFYIFRFGSVGDELGCGMEENCSYIPYLYPIRIWICVRLVRYSKRISLQPMVPLSSPLLRFCAFVKIVTTADSVHQRIQLQSPDLDTMLRP